MKRALAALALSALFCVKPALADSGIEMLAAHAACDGSVFSALSQDAKRWSKQPGFGRKGRLAHFTVANRRPAGPSDNEKTEARFTPPVTIGGLTLLSYFDADLSAWSYFRSSGLDFVSWGFNVQQSPEEVAAWVSERAPAIGKRLAQRVDGTPQGVFCTVDTWENGRWTPLAEACDTGLPIDPAPRRVFAIRSSAMYDNASVMSCEVFGVLKPDMMKTVRPDL